MTEVPTFSGACTVRYTRRSSWTLVGSRLSVVLLSWSRDVEVPCLKTVLVHSDLLLGFEVYSCVGSVVELKSEHSGTRLLDRYDPGVTTT